MTPPVPDMPPAVAGAFAALPAPVAACLTHVRSMIYAVAAETATAPLTETLKWGEPAYLTEATRSGTTIRLGQVRGQPGAAILFNCRTSLVPEFRDRFGTAFRFDGTRALLLDPDAPLPEAPLAHCLARALTYHRSKRHA